MNFSFWQSLSTILSTDTTRHVHSGVGAVGVAQPCASELYLDGQRKEGENGQDAAGNKVMIGDWQAGGREAGGRRTQGDML
jgi:hypothetical protein